MANHDLKNVAAKAATDKAFFEDLLKDPDKALAGAKIVLSSEQLQTLKYGLKDPQTISVDVVKFIGGVHATNAIPEWGGVLPGGRGGRGGDH